MHPGRIQQAVGTATKYGVGFRQPVARPVLPVQDFAREARDQARELLAGRRVWLDYDQTRRYRYGRTLVYFFHADGTLLKLRLIDEGYVFAYTKYSSRADYIGRFRAAEQRARVGVRGLWATR